MKGSKILSVIAIIAAVSGIAIAMGRYMKKKGISIRDALDYKNNIFEEDDDILDSEYDIAEEQPLTAPEDYDEQDVSQNDISQNADAEPAEDEQTEGQNQNLEF